MATSSAQNPTRTYSTEGEYTVSLQVTNGTETKSITKTISVYNDLVADFTVSGLSGVSPFDVELNSSISTGVITSRTWFISPATSFTYLSGDPHAVKPTVRFNQKGVYRIILRVVDGVKAVESEEKVINVQSTDLKPTIEWQGPVYAGRPVRFKDRTLYACVGSTEPSWTFESFFTGTGSTIDHTFANPGVYPVVMTVTDGCGLTRSKTISVTVLQPSANFFPLFSMDKSSIRAGQTVTFYDNSYATPPDQIGLWVWWFEQPGSLLPEQNVVPNSHNRDYSSKPNPSQVTHRYETPGVYTVRLVVSRSVSEQSIWADQKIEVRATPQLTPGYIDPVLQNYSANDKVLNFSHIDDNIFAYQHAYLGAEPYGKIEVYKKGTQGVSDWQAAGYYSSQSGINQTMRLRDFRIKSGKILSQLRAKNAAATTPYAYQFIEGVGVSNSALTALAENKIPASLFANIANTTDQPSFSFYGDEAVVMQKEGNGNIYMYIIKKGATWSASTATKINVGTGTVGEIFMDENVIVAHNGYSATIFEKTGTVWSTVSKSLFSLYGGTSFNDIGYAGNTVIASLNRGNCPVYDHSLPIAVIFEKPIGGWMTTNTPTAKLLLDKETEVDANTQVCSEFINTKNVVNLADKYATVRVTLKNGSSAVDRVFVYKKWYDEWITMNQNYKLNTALNEMGDEFEIHGTDILHTYISNIYGMDEGRAEVHSLENYCFPVVSDKRTSFSLSGNQADVRAGFIQLGGGSAIINSGASVNYRAQSLVLKPGFKASSGSTVSIKSIMCDNLYWND